MADLTTLPNVKQWLGVQSVADDSLLSRLISASSDFITTWLGRDVTLQSYNSYRDGSDGNVMICRNYPVQSVSLLSIDGNVVPAAVFVSPWALPSPGFVFDQFSIMLVGGVYRFTRGYQNVYISYQAGYSTIPTEIEQAAIELISIRYKERDHIGQISKNIGGEIISYSQKDITDSIQTTLGQYQRVMQP
jgi:hypothetical protein